MSECGWCGKAINGDSVLTIMISAIIMYDGETDFEIMPGYVVDFCCHGCAWAFEAEYHRLMGLLGKELRNHLIEIHGLNHPPGKPAGGMKRDCIIVEMAKSLASVFI